MVDPTLGVLPYQYAILGEGPSPVYPTLDDAIAGRNAFRSIAAGNLRYVSYIDYAETDHGRFFQLRSGGWMRVASRVSDPAQLSGWAGVHPHPAQRFWLDPALSTQRRDQTHARL